MLDRDLPVVHATTCAGEVVGSGPQVLMLTAATRPPQAQLPTLGPVLNLT